MAESTGDIIITRKDQIKEEDLKQWVEKPLPVFSRFEYLKKLQSWADVYRVSEERPTENESWMVDGKMQREPVKTLAEEFDPHWEFIFNWVNTISLPERGTAEEFCSVILNYAGGEASGPFTIPWRYINLRVRKSNCLGRMLYSGEDLRTEKCPEHKGHWSGYNSQCELGCQMTGWLPR